MNEPLSVISADYVVIGAGAMGMALSSAIGRVVGPPPICQECVWLLPLGVAFL